jgi:hypothetical protein
LGYQGGFEINLTKNQVSEILKFINTTESINKEAFLVHKLNPDELHLFVKRFDFFEVVNQHKYEYYFHAWGVTQENLMQVGIYANDKLIGCRIIAAYKKKGQQFNHSWWLDKGRALHIQENDVLGELLSLDMVKINKLRELNGPNSRYRFDLRYFNYFVEIVDPDKYLYTELLVANATLK